MKERTLRIAKSKVRHSTGHTYCGCLTPTEFLALVEAGIRITKYDLDKARRWKEKGYSNPSWYYFDLGPVTLKQ